jgi:hypothetical protein
MLVVYGADVYIWSESEAIPSVIFPTLPTREDKTKMIVALPKWLLLVPS